MSVTFTQDIKPMKRAVKKLSTPLVGTYRGFDGAIHKLFLETQSDVHVITSSLKNSGVVETFGSRSAGIWEGYIIYGGRSDGSVHDPVEYANQERDRGAEHDFFASIEDDESLLPIIEAHLRRAT